MAYALILDGSRYMTAPTLGNLLNEPSVRIEMDNVSMDDSNGYIWSQAGSSNRELGVYINGGFLSVIAGGLNSTIGTLEDAFGGSPVEGDLVFDINLAEGTAVFSKDGVITSTSNISVGSDRFDGTLFRIGARGNNNDPGDTSGGFRKSFARVGNTRIYKSGVLARNYVSDGQGDAWADTEDGQDGVIQNGTGDSTQWLQIIAPPVEQDIAVAIPAPAFSATAKMIVAPVEHSISVDIAGPVFSATADVIKPPVEHDISASIPAPTFSAVAVMGEISIIVNQQTNIDLPFLSNNITL